MKNFFLILCFATLLTSCAKSHEQIVNIPEPLEEIQTDATKTSSDGSLWPHLGGLLSRTLGYCG